MTLDYFTCDSDDLQDIPENACNAAEIVGQVKKIALNKGQHSAVFADEAAIKDLANWTPLRAAVDSTKVIVTPRTTGLVFPKSEQITGGGNDNTTVDGIEEHLGEGSVKVTGMFKNISPSIYQALRKLLKYSFPYGANGSELRAFFFTEGGILAEKTADGGFRGIQITNLWTSTQGLNGKNTIKENDFSFVLNPLWDKEVYLIKPDFDPLSL